MSGDKRSVTRVCNGSGDVVLFIAADSPSNVTDLCRRHRIITRALPTGATLAHDRNGFVVKANRYTGYARVCEPGVYAWCLATDFRDVFFQADPFAAPSLRAALDTHDLVLQEEFAPVTLGACPYNSRWLRSCWGAGVLRAIGNFTPVCSGTILGTPRGFAALATGMLREMQASAAVEGCSARDQVISERETLLLLGGVRGSFVTRWCERWLILLCYVLVPEARLSPRDVRDTAGVAK